MLNTTQNVSKVEAESQDVDFRKVYFAMAAIVDVKQNKNAKIPAFLLQLDFGTDLLEEHNTKYKKKYYKSSAQLCGRYKAQDLLGKQVLCVVNFPRKQIGNTMSDCLVTGVQQADLSAEKKRATTTTLSPTQIVANGSKVGIWGESIIYTTNPRNLSWKEFTALDLRIATILKCRKRPIKQSDCADEKEKKGANIPSKKGIACIELSITIEGKKKQAFAYLQNDYKTQTLLNNQYLFYYMASKACYYLCTINGNVLLTPSLPAGDGFKLA